MLPLGLGASDRDPRIMAPLMASQNKVLLVFCTKGWGKGTRMTSLQAPSSLCVGLRGSRMEKETQ